jgi:hypothetical protein
VYKIYTTATAVAGAGICTRLFSHTKTLLRNSRASDGSTVSPSIHYQSRSTNLDEQLHCAFTVSCPLYTPPHEGGGTSLTVMNIIDAIRGEWDLIHAVEGEDTSLSFHLVGCGSCNSLSLTCMHSPLEDSLIILSFLRPKIGNAFCEA